MSKKMLRRPQGKIEESRRKIENTKKSVDVTKKKLEKDILLITKSISDSNNAKKILFESLISLYMARVEEFINLKAGQAESFAIVNPSTLADHILEIKDPVITVTLFNKIYFKILGSQQNKNKLSQARIDHFANYMHQYISTKNKQQQAVNHLAEFLSRFNLLVTDTKLEVHFEVNSDSFNSQLDELETVYKLDINKQINEDDELKNNLGKFIEDAIEEKVYIDRIEAVRERIPMPWIKSDVSQ